MISSALAQRFHWYQVGSARNKAIADWQVSRVMAVLGYADLSRRFGERSLAVCKDNDLDAFVTGFAHEAIARAAGDVDDLATFEEHFAAANQQLSKIEDEDDQKVLADDLNEFS